MSSLLINFNRVSFNSYYCELAAFMPFFNFQSYDYYNFFCFKQVMKNALADSLFEYCDAGKNNFRFSKIYFS